MGKTKQVKEKKFNRNVEISAPILDPEIIRAIHTPPKGQRLDIKHGGFKALLSDLNSQDSTDELMPLNDNHVPSYIGISCAVSGYSNYSSYSKRSSSPAPQEQQTTALRTTTSNLMGSSTTPNRSQTTSPIQRHHNSRAEVHHITIDKNNIHSVDEERKELTEKLTASVTERRRSPSPITPTEDDRHHGAYVGARYCPLPPPSKLVNKHIPLLGIDDDKDPDEYVEDNENKVEQKIASLYGDDFVEDWRESMTHKAKKEMDAENVAPGEQQQQLKSPKDLVTLKPTPVKVVEEQQSTVEAVDIPTNSKVLASVEKNFLNKLMTDENPPMPSQSPTRVATPKFDRHEEETLQQGKKINASPSPPPSPAPLTSNKQAEEEESYEQQQQQQQSQNSPVQAASPSPPTPPPMSPDSGSNQSFVEEKISTTPAVPQAGSEEHIEYEIRAQSPVDNESSPIKIRHQSDSTEGGEGDYIEAHLDETVEQKLVSFSEPKSSAQVYHHSQTDEQLEEEEHQQEVVDLVDTTTNELEKETEQSASDTSNGGLYYLGLLDQEKSFILEQVNRAERILENHEAELDEDNVGQIRSAIGKASLLCNKKCNQFKELCEANVNSNNLGINKQFATLNDDLAGFWDMISIQINDVRKSFEAIWEAERNGWPILSSSSSSRDLESDNPIMDGADARRIECTSASMEGESIIAKSSTASIVKPKLSAQKDQIRRERLQEHINQLKQNKQAAARVNEEEEAEKNFMDGSERPTGEEEANNDDAAAAGNGVENQPNQQLQQPGSQGYGQSESGRGETMGHLEEEKEGDNEKVEEKERLEAEQEAEEQLISFIG